MHPVFFLWFGTDDELHATQFYQHGRRFRSVALTHDIAYIGIIEGRTGSVRKHLDKLHERFTLLPGPNGLINAQQAQSLNSVLPQAHKVKEGDSMRGVLQYVYSLYGDSEFDPDGY